MKIVVGIVMGFFSGLLIYFGLAMLFMGSSTSQEPSVPFVFITFVGGWAASTYLLVRGARTVSKVFARGFLLGAAEWLGMIPIGLLAGGRAASLAGGSGTEAELAGAAIGGGLVAVITGGLSVAMAMICLLGFAVAHFMGREMKHEQAPATKKCPDCAELVQAEARKCRFCGADLTSANAHRS